MKIGALLLALLTAVANADWLETNDSVFQIDLLCPEGYVTCEWVNLVEQDKTSGEVNLIRGRTVHTTCADGVSPCRFIGYRFEGPQSNIVMTEKEDGYQLREEALTSATVLRDVNLKPLSQKIDKVVMQPSCYSSSSRFIELMSADSLHKETYWLVGAYDGKACADSTLEINLVRARDAKLISPIARANYRLLTMYDTAEGFDEQHALAHRKMEQLMNDIFESEQWPEFESAAPDDYWDEETGGMVQLGISRSYYDQLRTSGARYFSFAIGSSPGSAFAFDVTKGEIVEVSASAQ